LNGGVFASGAMNNSGSGINYFNLNGAKIVCLTNSIFPGGVNGGGNPLQMMVGDGGATIDTVATTNVIGAPLQYNGGGGLTKLGVGELDLNATNTYAGPTVVSNGVLMVNGELSASSSVEVISGATLGGSGTIGGAVNFDSGSHALLSTAGALTIGGALTIATTGTIPNVHLALSNDVPAGTYTLATYNASGSSGSFNTNVIVDSGSLAAGNTANVATAGGFITLNVAAASTPSPTNITYTVSGGTMTLNWPAGQGWLLQSNSVSLSNSNAWQTVPGATPPFPITTDPARPNVFYRLKF
jgi:autotransporter-associated beta strand protein